MQLATVEKKEFREGFGHLSQAHHGNMKLFSNSLQNAVSSIKTQATSAAAALQRPGSTEQAHASKEQQFLRSVGGCISMLMVPLHALSHSALTPTCPVCHPPVQVAD